MKSFKTISEGLIKEPPQVYKQFEKAVVLFALSHMMDQVGAKYRKPLSEFAKQFGFRTFRKPKPKASTVYKQPHSDIPYQDIDVDPSDKITLFMVYDERNTAHNADYDSDYNGTGNPAITIYVSNYMRNIIDARNDKELLGTIHQIIIRLQADLKHELMHYVQDVFLANKDEKQNQRGKLSDNSIMTDKDKIEYYTSQQEFAPTIRSEIGEFVSEFNPNPPELLDYKKYYNKELKKKFDNSEFFQTLKKHLPEKYKLAVKKFIAGVERYLASKNVKK